MRQRKIVNAGEALRFDMEGLSADLPPHKRVLGYDIWFDPLPRTTTGKVKRHAVMKRLIEQREAKAPAEPMRASATVDAAWLDDRRTRGGGRGDSPPRRKLAPAWRPAPTSSSTWVSTRWSVSSCSTELEQTLRRPGAGRAIARDLHGAAAGRGGSPGRRCATAAGNLSPRRCATIPGPSCSATCQPSTTPA